MMAVKIEDGGQKLCVLWTRSFRLANITTMQNIDLCPYIYIYIYLWLAYFQGLAAWVTTDKDIQI